MTTIHQDLNVVRSLVESGDLTLNEGDTVHTWFATDYFGNPVRNDGKDGWEMYSIEQEDSGRMVAVIKIIEN